MYLYTLQSGKASRKYKLGGRPIIGSQLSRENKTVEFSNKSVVLLQIKIDEQLIVN